jgi:hypothetical protein
LSACGVSKFRLLVPRLGLEVCRKVEHFKTLATCPGRKFKSMPVDWLWHAAKCLSQNGAVTTTYNSGAMLHGGRPSKCGRNQGAH